MSLFKKLLDIAQKNRSPVDYWRKKGAHIGKNCEVYPSVNLGSEPYLIHIGNHVRINGGVSFVTHDGGVWVLRDYLNTADHDKIDIFGTIQIGSNVHIGTNAIIMPNVTVGDNCIIGCSAVVTKDVPSGSIAAGVPARIIKTIDEYAAQHSLDFDYTKHLSPAEKQKYLREKFDLK